MDRTEYQRAQAARVPYLEPVGLCDEGTALRRPSEISLQESYETQQHLRLSVSRHLLVEGADPIETRLPESSRPARYLISAWNPYDRPATIGENEQATHALRERLDGLGAEVVRDVVTCAPDRSWVEDCLLIAGVESDTALELGREFGQPMVTAVDNDRVLSCWPTGVVPGLVARTRPIRELPARSGCPMRTDDEAARCVMRGGPGPQAAMNAAALWSTHRGLLLGRLGCEACVDGSEPLPGVGGRPITLREPYVASRYGGYFWSPTAPSDACASAYELRAAVDPPPPSTLTPSWSECQRASARGPASSSGHSPTPSCVEWAGTPDAWRPPIPGRRLAGPGLAGSA